MLVLKTTSPWPATPAPNDSPWCTEPSSSNRYTGSATLFHLLCFDGFLVSHLATYQGCHYPAFQNGALQRSVFTFGSELPGIYCPLFVRVEQDDICGSSGLQRHQLRI